MAVLFDRDQAACAGLVLSGSGSGQTPGKYLSQREYRAGERAKDGLRRDGNRHLGSYRSRQNEAFWVYAILSRTRTRRALHPDRSVLSNLESARVRAQHAIHRAGGRDQYLDARVCGSPRCRRA